MPFKLTDQNFVCMSCVLGATSCCTQVTTDSHKFSEMRVWSTGNSESVNTDRLRFGVGDETDLGASYKNDTGGSLSRVKAVGE
jgi:hypothetical protein